MSSNLLDDLLIALNNKKDSYIIEENERKISEDFDQIYKNPSFYSLHFDNILSIINKVDFSSYYESYDMIKFLISTIYSSSYSDKAILLLNSIHCRTCGFNLSECLNLIKMFYSSELIASFASEYEQYENTLSVDYEYQLNQQRELINSLNLSIQKHEANEQQQKPADLEPNIYEAIQNGNLKHVKYFIEVLETNPNLVDEKNHNLVYYSLLHGKENIANYFISIGLKKPEFPPIIYEPDDYEHDIFVACENGKLTSVQFKLENTSAEPNETNSSGETPLFIACRAGHLQIVRYLIEIWNVEINIRNNLLITPYLAGLIDQQYEIVQYFIKNKNYPKPPNDFESNIYEACAQGKLSSIKFLVKQCGTEILLLRDYGGYFPIHYACENAHLNVIQYLAQFDESDEICNQQTEDHLTPLHILCKTHFDTINKENNNQSSQNLNYYYNIIPILKILITKVNNNPDKYKRTCLHYACENSLPIVQYLVEEAKFDIEFKDNNNETPIFYAVRESKLDIVQYLIKIGANTNVIAKDQKTLIDYANNDSIRQLLIDI